MRYLRWMFGVLLLILSAPSWSFAQGVILYNASGTAGGGAGTLPLGGKYASVLVEVTIQTTATVSFYISGEGSNPKVVACTDISSTTGSASTTATATGTYICPANGATAFYASVGAHTNGVRVFASPSAGSASRRGGAGGGSGTVTSISASGGVETISGSPITGSGTIRGALCVKSVTATTYTVLTGDRGCFVTFSNANPIAVTLPQAGTTGFETNWFFIPVNLGAGTVTITPTTSTIQGEVDLDLATGKSTLIGSDGTNYVHSPGMGLTAESDTIDTVFDRGGTITGAVSFATALKLLDANGDGFAWYVDPTNGPTFVCVDNNVENACTSYTRTLAAGQTLVYKNSGGTNIFHLAESTGTLTLGGQLVTSNLGIEFTESNTNPSCSSGNYTIYADTSEAKLKKCENGTPSDLAPAGGGGGTKSKWFGANALTTDGALCNPPALANLNSSGLQWTITCADDNGSTIYGRMKMPQAWNAGTLVFRHIYIQTAADTGILNGDIAAQCRGAGETPSSTYGTEVAIDDAAVTGSNAVDITASAAVTPAGTCAAGDVVWWRYQLDVATTTAVATLHHLGFEMEWTE